MNHAQYWEYRSTLSMDEEMVWDLGCLSTSRADKELELPNWLLVSDMDSSTSGI